MRANYDLKYGFCKKSLRKNETLTSCPFFSFFFISYGWVHQQTQPKVIEKMKKWATGQSFIRKEITSYRIGTLTQLICLGFSFYNKVFTLLPCLSSLLRVKETRH